MLTEAQLEPLGVQLGGEGGDAGGKLGGVGLHLARGGALRGPDAGIEVDVLLRAGKTTSLIVSCRARLGPERLGQELERVVWDTSGPLGRVLGGVRVVWDRPKAF